MRAKFVYREKRRDRGQSPFYSKSQFFSKNLNVSSGFRPSSRFRRRAKIGVSAKCTILTIVSVLLFCTVGGGASDVHTVATAHMTIRALMLRNGEGSWRRMKKRRGRRDGRKVHGEGKGSMAD